MSNLHPCPFCGSTDLHPAPRIGYPVRVECNRCFAIGPQKLTAREAEQAWNERAAITIRGDGSAQIIINEEVRREMQRAIRKFPTWPTDPLHALGVVTEEHGEVAKAVLQHIYEGGSRSEIAKESIQLAAMSLRFAASLEAYQYLPSIQHVQKAEGGGAA